MGVVSIVKMYITVNTGARFGPFRDGACLVSRTNR